MRACFLLFIHADARQFRLVPRPRPTAPTPRPLSSQSFHGACWSATVAPRRRWSTGSSGCCWRNNALDDARWWGEMKRVPKHRRRGPFLLGVGPALLAKRGAPSIEGTLGATLSTPRQGPVVFRWHRKSRINLSSRAPFARITTLTTGHQAQPCSHAASSSYCAPRPRPRSAPRYVSCACFDRLVWSGLDGGVRAAYDFWGPRPGQPEQNSIWEERPLIEDGAVADQGVSKRPYHGRGRPQPPPNAGPHTCTTVLRRSVRLTDPSISACTPNEQAPAAVATKAAMSSLSEPAYLSRPYKDIPKVRPVWVWFLRKNG